MNNIQSILDLPTIAVSSGKGGAGKSTTAAAVAAQLTRNGHRVLLIDGDTTAPNAHIVAGLHHRNELAVKATGPNLRVEAPLTPLGYRLLSPLCATSGQKAIAGFDTLYTLAGHCIDDTDIIIVDCPPGWTSTHTSIAATQPIWLLTALWNVAAISDHHKQTGQITAAHSRTNRDLRDSDKRRNWDHLNPDPNIVVVETLADRPTLSAVTPDQTIAEIAGTNWAGSIPTVTDLDDLINSREIGDLAERLTSHITAHSG